MSINFWGLGNPNYLAPYLDGFGGEGDTDNGTGTNWTPEILDYRRSVAYRRALHFANQTVGLTSDAAYSFSRWALLYGIYPGVGNNAGGWDPEATQMIEDTDLLVKQFWGSGWEPVTYGRSGEEARVYSLKK